MLLTGPILLPVLSSYHSTAVETLRAALVVAWVYDWTPKGNIVAGDNIAWGPQLFEIGEPEPIDLNELKPASPAHGELIGHHD
jgi:hypothetical protein